MQKEEQRLFSHPSEAELQAGLACDDAECSGEYVRKTRDIRMKKGNGLVTIEDSEYWECESCGSFTTAKEEMQKIQEKARNQANYTGRLTLRLPPELHRQLAEEAQTNHRSLNNELAFRLSQSLKGETRSSTV